MKPEGRSEEVAGGQPPSSGDLKLAQGVIDAWAHGEVEWLLEHSAHDVEFRPMMWTDVPFRGREGTIAFVGEFLAAYKGLTIEVDSVRQAQNPVVLDVHVRAHLRESRAEFDDHFTLIFWIRDGELVLYEGHVDEEGLAAALARPT
jgi:ketosteroid isomerase-like protein